MSADAAWLEDRLRDAVNVCYGGVTHEEIDEHTTRRNLLAAAVKAPTIDDAIKPIMDALGIVSGDVAGQSFSTSSQEEWAVMAVHHRVSLIADWLFDELDVARRRMP